MPAETLMRCEVVEGTTYRVPWALLGSGGRDAYHDTYSTGMGWALLVLGSDGRDAYSSERGWALLGSGEARCLL